MSITNYDLQTLVDLLFWVNISSLALVKAYVFTHKDASERYLARWLILAKFFLSVAFLLIEHRTLLPRFLGFNIANSLLIAGALAEARVILAILGERKGGVVTRVTVAAIVGIVLYNLADMLLPAIPIRMTVSSATMFAIMINPAIRLIRLRQPFKCIIGLSYMIYVTLLLPRGLIFYFDPEAVYFSRALIEGLTFLVIILLSTFNLPAMLLLMKEEADKQLREMARTDFLSGLSNRQYFLETTTLMFQRHKREERSCCVMFLDIDHFKKVNDTHGHPFGDEVIRRVSEVLKATIRGYDIPCRFGGEEFACFVNNVDESAALALAERIRRVIEEQTFPEKPGFGITMSIGVAMGVPRNGDTITTFIDAADEELYKAKQGGRNRVVGRIMGERSEEKKKAGVPLQPALEGTGEYRPA